MTVPMTKMERIRDTKLRSGCMLCGYRKHHTALVFHHRNPKDKKFSIKSGNQTRAWDKIEEEIEKCEVLCANCHQIVHYIMESNG